MFQTITLFGSTIKLYDLFNNLATVMEIILLLVLIKDYKSACTLPVLADRHFNKKRKTDYFHSSIFMILELAVVLFFSMQINNLCGPALSKVFLGTNDANYFPNILVSPILLFVLCIPFKASPFKALDFAAPFSSIALIFYKLACFCEGCCNGIEYGTLFFNHKTERYEMPVQLIEMACAIIMFVILLIMRKHKKKHGLMYPAFMVMYCGSRFCSEFLRDDYPQIIGRMTGYHVQCIIGFVLGLIYLIIVLKFGERITNYFETKNKAFLDRKLAEYDEKHAVTHHSKKKKK